VRSILRAVRNLLLVLAIAACSDPARPTPQTPTAPAEPPVAAQPVPPPAAPTTVKRLFVTHGRASGTFDVTTNADGTIATKLVIVQNGRGPKVDATERLASDGTLAAWSGAGQHEMGTKVAEVFTRTGDAARWKSEEEAGERTVAGTAMYVPLADAPDVPGLIVRAALRHGGTLPLLPGGEARVTKAIEYAASANGATAKLTCYAITGLALEPQYTWMDETGAWWGTTAPWGSIVPAGWESAIDTLVAKQTEVTRARDEELAVGLAHRAPPAGLAYTHARVLDVAKHKWLADMTVVVAGDKIAAVGPSKSTKVPDGAEVVDLAGKALLPGMIDMHAHLGPVDGALDIASGVTTARDVGNDPDFLDDLKRRYDEGVAVGPSVVRMGFIEGRGDKAAGSKITAETADEAAAAVDFYAKRGYDGIKIYNSMKVELVPVLAKLAHDKGMLVTGHIPVHMLAREAVAAGYDGIEHINMLFLNFLATHDTDTRDTTRFTLVGEQGATLDLASKPVREFLDYLRTKKTVIDPTLDAFEDLFVGVPGRVSAGLEDTVGRLPIVTQRQFLIGGLPLTGDRQTKFRAAWERIFAMVKALHAAQVPIVVGTDSIAGVMFHHELDLLVRTGLDAGTVLEMATLGAARAMRLDGKLGSITAGKRADLVVVDGDPLADIRAARRIVTVMRAGVVYPSAPLYESVGVKPGL
jgi:amidohydrolase family protein